VRGEWQEEGEKQIPRVARDDKGGRRGRRTPRPTLAHTKPARMGHPQPKKERRADNLECGGLPPLSRLTQRRHTNCSAEMDVTAKAGASSRTPKTADAHGPPPRPGRGRRQAAPTRVGETQEPVFPAKGSGTHAPRKTDHHMRRTEAGTTCRAPTRTGETQEHRQECLCHKSRNTGHGSRVTGHESRLPPAVGTTARETFCEGDAYHWTEARRGVCRAAVEVKGVHCADPAIPGFSVFPAEHYWAR
jgi:hypothetical protein